MSEITYWKVELLWFFVAVLMTFMHLCLLHICYEPMSTSRPECEGAWYLQITAFSTINSVTRTESQMEWRAAVLLSFFEGFHVHNTVQVCSVPKGMLSYSTCPWKSVCYLSTYLNNSFFMSMLANTERGFFFLSSVPSNHVTLLIFVQLNLSSQCNLSHFFKKFISLIIWY